MSKSLNNYVGIDEPAREMYGKIMSLPDELMWKYYRYILCEEEAAIEQMRSDVSGGVVHPRAAKDQLAQAIVTRFIDADAAAEAAAEFTRIFAEKALPNDIPEVVVAAEEVGLLTLMVQAGLAKSNGEARRLVKQGAVRIDEERISDERAMIRPQEGMVVRSVSADLQK